MTLPLHPRRAEPNAPPELLPASPALASPALASPFTSSAEPPLVDLARLRELAGFPLRSLRRRRGIAAALGGGVAVLALLAAAFLPRTYEVETRILAQRNYVMPALGNPRRAVPNESDAPTRLAAEAVMSRENLEQVIRDAHLLEQWAIIRSPLGRLKERVFRLFGRKPASTADKVDMLVEVLEKKLWVSTGEAADGTVAITVNWPEPRTALQIVEAAQRNFLEQRHASEVARIEESITILERHVDTAQAGITQALDALGPDAARSPRTQALLSAAAGVRRTRAAADARTTPNERPSVVSSPVDLMSGERGDLQRALLQKQTLIDDMESARTRRVAELQTQLADLRNRYGSAHPEVIATQQSIETLGTDSPQLALLRTETASLRERLLALGPPPAARPTIRGAIPDREALDAALAAAPDASEGNPRLAYAESRLKIAIADYEDLLDRLEGARIELETARAAFKYRYSVVSPAQLPRKPVKPNAMLLAVGGLVLGAGLAVFAAVALDLAGGRALEPWQVERELGVPVLGRMRQP